MPGRSSRIPDLNPSRFLHRSAYSHMPSRCDSANSFRLVTSDLHPRLSHDVALRLNGWRLRVAIDSRRCAGERQIAHFGGAKCDYLPVERRFASPEAGSRQPTGAIHLIETSTRRFLNDTCGERAAGFHTVRCRSSKPVRHPGSLAPQAAFACVDPWLKKPSNTRSQRLNP